MLDQMTGTESVVDPDYALIREIAAGSGQALDMLYARHGPSILNFLVTRLSDRQKAEEVLQDVMMAAWRGAGNFRGESRVLTWLLSIARNRAINVYRKHTPDTVSLDEEIDMHGTDTGPLEKVVKLDQSKMVRHAMETLPEHHREILTLVFFQQLSGTEAAQVLDISPGTVKSRLHRAKEALRRILLQNEEIQ